MLILIARISLAAVFGVAGLAKLADRDGSRRAMGEFGIPRFLVGPTAHLLPIAELGCAVAFLPLASAWFAALFAIVLLAVFIAGIGFDLARGRRPDCHCFGQLHSAPIGWTTVLRNVVLLSIAGFILAGRETPGMSLSAASLSVGGSAAAVTILVGIAIAAFLLFMIFHLLRQNGRLLLRLEAIEAKLGIGPALPEAPGLPIGARAPAFALETVDGARASLATLARGGHPVLLVFGEPGCQACDGLLPEVAGWQRQHADRMSVALISRGDLEANRAKAATHGLANVLLQVDREVAEAYRVAGTPSAVLVDGRAIASAVAAGADAIRALVADAAVPRAKRGEVVPALALPDLDGRRVELSATGGRRTLLVFWNPACGYCERMLPDLKAWERAATDAQPHLVVVAAGSAAANREQGFTSTVLLDADFQAGRAFGSTGTPSAVLLDAAGRLASDVAVGAEAIFGLVNSGRQLVTR